MKASRFSEDVRPISDVKLHTAAIVDQTRKTRRPILLTRRGRPVAVLMGLDEYETLTDRAAFIEAVESGSKAARSGDLHPHHEAQQILDSFGK
jgi:prevent-host-death family protein